MVYPKLRRDWPRYLLAILTRRTDRITNIQEWLRQQLARARDCLVCFFFSKQAIRYFNCTHYPDQHKGTGTSQPRQRGYCLSVYTTSPRLRVAGVCARPSLHPHTLFIFAPFFFFAGKQKHSTFGGERARPWLTKCCSTYSSSSRPSKPVCGSALFARG